MASSAGPRDDTVVQAGLEYWESQPASLDGVLGTSFFPSSHSQPTSLLRVDALGSRWFLLDLIPDLRSVPSAIRPLGRSSDRDDSPPKCFRALDVGVGIGRVTADVLLHLVSDVVLLEPVRSFIAAGLADGWTGIRDRTKSGCFFKDPLQDFDPARPGRGTEASKRLGYVPEEDDVVWSQWCLGHLNDEDLVAFLKRSAVALRSIVVKKNLTVFDEQDSSWTR
ncbi:Alpha-N-methyltransferase NTM1 [Tylopilus felleus]